MQMCPLGSLALLLLLLLVGEGARARNSGKRRESDGSTPGANATLSGRFTARDGSQCTWTAHGAKVVALRCTAGARGAFTCEYAGEPEACVAKGSGARRYWRQVTHALAKHTQLCEDERAVVRAGKCTRFRLATLPTTTRTATLTTKMEPTESTRAPECRERADHGKVAEEKCGETWSSICTFIFTILQSEGDC
ncbi:fibroblast growth factor-binding protein 1 [Hoplias malabaricus]|uniref:fibroblast growth factor-binding protein 1 n=1 Tax=Hoplias malabaricus TaxID=27720 RepID=UPI0034631F76